VRLAEGRKTATLDGKAVRRDSASLGGAGVVVFGPEDLRLPKAAGADRRRALDRAVFAVHRTYSQEAAMYERALRGRNSLLRQGNLSKELVESYEETLARTGARIVARRREVTGRLCPRFERAFEDIHGEKRATIRYRSHDEVEAAETENEVNAAIRRGLGEQRKVDERRGFTGFGPHTDDLEMMLEGRPARVHGSQGQLRSLMLAFKFAELGYVEEGNAEAPLFLLDDVASELDERRRTRLFEAISGRTCQTVLTVTERELLPRMPGRADWEVRDGHLERV
jgi:DNA replication and repair protein RecF